MRINELAREVEVKAKAIIDYLAEIGIEDKRSHSSSIEGDLANKVTAHFQAQAEAERKKPIAVIPKPAPPPKPVPPAAESRPWFEPSLRRRLKPERLNGYFIPCR